MKKHGDRLEVYRVALRYPQSMRMKSFPQKRESTTIDPRFRGDDSSGVALKRRLLAFVTLVALLFPPLLEARSQVSVDQYVRQFEASYHNVETLQADFTQTSFAWGRTREESGTVYLARGGRMHWTYNKPEEKIFLSNGKQLLLYVPAEKQLTISSIHDIEDARVPIELLVSHLQMSRAFSRINFADQALKAEPGDRVLRGYPQFRYKGDYRSVLIEVTPKFDVRRLVVFYPDNSTMQFAFSHLERNKALSPSLFSFTPPPGTEVIRH